MASSLEYQQSVLDHLQDYADLSFPKKATLAERLLIRHASPDNLHPNPDDEFSDPAVGPNFEIVSNYRNSLEKHMRRNAEETNFDPITVEKLSSGGYRIMNGHHRWLAAKMLRVNKVPIQIVNPIHIEDIIAMIEKLNEDMAVFFDLDEVLFCDEDAENVDKLSYPLNRIFKERLRLGTAILIPELRREGFEVWVYTTSFRSELYIRTLFRFYGIRFDGIVNGQRHQKEVQGDRRDPMPNKLPSFYHITLHIDDEAIVATYGKTYGFDVYQLDAQDDDWAEKIMDRVRTIKKNKF